MKSTSAVQYHTKVHIIIMNTTMQHVPVFVYEEHSQVISNMQRL